MSDSATSMASSFTPPIDSDREHSDFSDMHSAMSSTSSGMSESEPRLILSIDIGTSQSAVAVFYYRRGKVEWPIASRTGLTPLR